MKRVQRVPLSARLPPGQVHNSSAPATPPELRHQTGNANHDVRVPPVPAGPRRRLGISNQGFLDTDPHFFDDLISNFFDYAPDVPDKSVQSSIEQNTFKILLFLTNNAELNRPMEKSEKIKASIYGYTSRNWDQVKNKPALYAITHQLIWGRPYSPLLRDSSQVSNFRTNFGRAQVLHQKIKTFMEGKDPERFQFTSQIIFVEYILKRWG